MARVTGVGGFFFRARDPDALNEWYARHFGVIMLDSREYSDPGWFHDRGETVFSAFAQDSDAFGAPDRTWKINFRVTDLDGAIEELRAAGVRVEPHEVDYPNGRFAELEDPEGNRIQLWEPNAASFARDPGPGGDRSPAQRPIIPIRRPKRGYEAVMKGFGLVRPRRGKWIAGVCAALADRLGTSPALMRLAFVLFGLFGVGELAYIALWIIIPKES